MFKITVEICRNLNFIYRDALQNNITLENVIGTAYINFKDNIKVVDIYLPKMINF